MIDLIPTIIVAWFFGWAMAGLWAYIKRKE